MFFLPLGPAKKNGEHVLLKSPHVSLISSFTRRKFNNEPSTIHREGRKFLIPVLGGRDARPIEEGKFNSCLTFWRKEGLSHLNSCVFRNGWLCYLCWKRTQSQVFTLVFKIWETMKTTQMTDDTEGSACSWRQKNKFHRVVILSWVITASEKLLLTLMAMSRETSKTDRP